VISLDDRRDIPACIAALLGTGDSHLIRLARWLSRKQQVAPLAELTDQIIEERLVLILHQSRHYGPATERGLAAMTVYAAKNREFDGVVVFWPYQIGGSDDHKRRLLYNAITRAKQWCVIVVQGDQILNGCPFKR
jgi:superfamily I DNA/RNA helicase